MGHSWATHGPSKLGRVWHSRSGGRNLEFQAMGGASPGDSLLRCWIWWIERSPLRCWNQWIERPSPLELKRRRPVMGVADHGCSILQPQCSIRRRPGSDQRWGYDHVLLPFSFCVGATSGRSRSWWWCPLCPRGRGNIPDWVGASLHTSRRRG
jgi:hypothetical protein